MKWHQQSVFIVREVVKKEALPTAQMVVRFLLLWRLRVINDTANIPSISCESTILSKKGNRSLLVFFVVMHHMQWPALLLIVMGTVCLKILIWSYEKVVSNNVNLKTYKNGRNGNDFNITNTSSSLPSFATYDIWCAGPLWNVCVWVIIRVYVGDHSSLIVWYGMGYGEHWRPSPPPPTDTEDEWRGSTGWMRWMSYLCRGGEASALHTTTTNKHPPILGTLSNTYYLYTPHTHKPAAHQTTNISKKRAQYFYSSASTSQQHIITILHFNNSAIIIIIF